MTFLLLAAGQVPGSWSSSKPAGQQGWEWLKWEEGGGPRIRKVGGLDQEGKNVPPLRALHAHRSQVSHCFLSLSFLIYTVGAMRHGSL